MGCGSSDESEYEPEPLEIPVDKHDAHDVEKGHIVCYKCGDACKLESFVSHKRACQTSWGIIGAPMHEKRWSLNGPRPDFAEPTADSSEEEFYNYNQNAYECAEEWACKCYCGKRVTGYDFVYTHVKVCEVFLKHHPEYRPSPEDAVKATAKAPASTPKPVAKTTAKAAAKSPASSPKAATKTTAKAVTRAAASSPKAAAKASAKAKAKASTPSPKALAKTTSKAAAKTPASSPKASSETGVASPRTASKLPESASSECGGREVAEPPETLTERSSQPIFLGRLQYESPQFEEFEPLNLIPQEFEMPKLPEYEDVELPPFQLTPMAPLEFKPLSFEFQAPEFKLLPTGSGSGPGTGPVGVKPVELTPIQPHKVMPFGMKPYEHTKLTGYGSDDGDDGGDADDDRSGGED